MSVVRYRRGVPEFEEVRRGRLREALTGRGAAFVLVTDLVNVRYLSGFTGSSGALLVGPDGYAVLATDSRYELQAGDEAPDVELLVTRAGPTELLARAAGNRPVPVLFEAATVSFEQHLQLSRDFAGELLPDDGCVTSLRQVKDSVELDLLAEACAASDQALAALLPRVRVGVTERQVARWLDDELRDRTPEGPGFDTIVAAGPNSAVPHHSPGARPIRSGDFLKIDFGARVGGYHADMTRTFVVGAPPAAWQQEIYDVVAAAQAAGKQALSAVALASEVDRAARDVVVEAGWGEHFSHGLGHGVGLQIHEAPFLGSTSPDRLRAAVPVTVEPGVYLPGRGGVRIEDTVVVHEDRVEPLTTASRDLLVLG